MESDCGYLLGCYSLLLFSGLDVIPHIEGPLVI